MARYFTHLIIIALLLWAPLAKAKEWPQPQTIGEAAAVQIWVWRTTYEDLDAIKAAGFNNVRFIMSWKIVEKWQDIYKWTQYDYIMRGLRERGMRAIVVLMGGNENYSPTGDPKLSGNDNNQSWPQAPTTPEAISAFARFAATAAERYQQQPVVWEIWNEPDIAHSWYPKMDAYAYAWLADATCRAIRVVQPDAKVIGPAAAAFPSLEDAEDSSFLGVLIQSAAADCLDALSIHPYRGGYKSPESVAIDYRNLAGFLNERKLTMQRSLPVLCTEWGYTTTKVTPEIQAAYVIRTLFANLLNDVKLSTWYEWRDSRDDGDKDHESNFGLYEYNNIIKPQTQDALPILSAIAKDQLVKRLDAGHPDVYAVLLRKPDDQNEILAWWAGDASSPIPKVVLHTGLSSQDITLSQMPQLIAVAEGAELRIKSLGTKHKP